MKFKNYIYFEERDDLRMGEMNLKPTNGGKVKDRNIFLFINFLYNRLYSIKMVLIKV